MAGVKISELKKWSADEVGETDTNDILIPVSIGNTTGALRASSLVEFLSANAPEHYMEAINERIDSLETAISSLQTMISNMNDNLVEKINQLETKYDEIVTNINEIRAEQQEIDSAQSEIITTHESTLGEINETNIAQDAAIEELRQIHDWETYNNHQGNNQNP